MGQGPNLGHVPHPPAMYGPSGSSGLRSHRGSTRDPRPFGSFLDFLVEGQVLESLQRVVEEATERMATMKTETGVPLVEVEDPVEVPRGGRRVRARPSLSTVHRHQVQPSLCHGHPNNYPSCSSSMSDTHSNATAGYPGSHGRDSDLGYRGLGPLPPIRDKLLQEKSLKRLLRLENRGVRCRATAWGGKDRAQPRAQGQAWLGCSWTPLRIPLSLQKRLSCSQGDALLWDSLGSSLGTPEASELGLGDRELKFLKREFNKEIKSLLSQSEAFNLPGYSSFREPHRTLDLLAKHHLFPALQRVVNQAVDKLSSALLQKGCPLFPSEWEPSTKPNLEITPVSKLVSSIPEEPYDDFQPASPSSFKMAGRRNKPRTRDKSKEGGSTMSNAQGTTRFRLQVIPTEEPKVPSPHTRQEAPDQYPKEQRTSLFSSGPLSSCQRAQPWRSLHITLPAPGIKVEVPKQTHLSQVTVPHAFHHLPAFVPLSSLVRKLTPTLASLYSEVTSSRAKLESLGANFPGKGPVSHHS